MTKKLPELLYRDRKSATGTNSSKISKLLPNKPQAQIYHKNTELIIVMSSLEENIKSRAVPLIIFITRLFKWKLKPRSLGPRNRKMRAKPYVVITRERNTANY